MNSSELETACELNSTEAMGCSARPLPGMLNQNPATCTSGKVTKELSHTGGSQEAGRGLLGSLEEFGVDSTIGSHTSAEPARLMRGVAGNRTGRSDDPAGGVPRSSGGEGQDDQGELPTNQGKHVYYPRTITKSGIVTRDKAHSHPT